MQNSLCACHARLDIAYLGMDDPSIKQSSRAALHPQAQPLTTPESKLSHGSAVSQAGRLVGPSVHSVAGQSVHSVAAVQIALDQLTGFLSCVERLLTGSFPVAVPIPAHGILMLLTRILSLDDSARQAGRELPQSGCTNACMSDHASFFSHNWPALPALLGSLKPCWRKAVFEHTI